MKKSIGIAIFAALTISVSVAQAVSPAPIAQPATVSSAAKFNHHGTFTVELTKALDSRKLKSGDQVVAVLTGGITLPDGAKISRGTRVIGHITEVKSRSNGDSESALQMTFDKFIVTGGEAIPMQATIRALAPNPNANLITGSMGDAYGNNLADATTHSAANSLTPQPIPLLNDESTGVLGLKDLQLGANGTVTSINKQVKLDSGTRLLLDARLE
jgi:hypothetical protein